MNQVVAPVTLGHSSCIPSSSVRDLSCCRTRVGRFFVCGWIGLMLRLSAEDDSEGRDAELARIFRDDVPTRSWVKTTNPAGSAQRDSNHRR
jgi:hypothetical protein